MKNGCFSPEYFAKSRPARVVFLSLMAHATAGPRRSRKSVDLPAPLGPATMTSLPGGILRSTPARLRCLAPLISIQGPSRSARLRYSPRNGCLIPRARKSPVIEEWFALISAGVPLARSAPPVDARARAEVDDEVRLLHQLVVVLHDDERVALVAQGEEGWR